jgi:hypothetical protein
MLRVMTRNQLRGLAGIAAVAGVILIAVPVLGVDPSRSPSTGTPPSAAPGESPSAAAPSASASPAAGPTKSTQPDTDGDTHGGKPDKAAKPHADNDAPEHPVNLTGVVATAGGEDSDYTLTVGPTVYALEAGPKWWWGDANPLAAVAGKTATIGGEQADGSNEVDVLSIDGKAIRPAGRPPWAGGWKVVGPKHPGWAQWKVDRLAGKGHGRDHAPGQQSQASPAP